MANLLSVERQREEQSAAGKLQCGGGGSGYEVVVMVMLTGYGGDAAMWN